MAFAPALSLKEGTMQQRVSQMALALAAALMGVAAEAALAGPPAAPWQFGDVGEPQTAGSTDVDANSVWTVKGSGDDVWGFADSFQLAYQPVKGDGSITARLLSRS